MLPVFSSEPSELNSLNPKNLSLIINLSYGLIESESLISGNWIFNSNFKDFFDFGSFTFFRISLFLLKSYVISSGEILNLGGSFGSGMTGSRTMSSRSK